MPRLSDSMEEGTIVAWVKRAGDTVREGGELVEIETDKAIVTYEAEHDGILEIIRDAGETVALGALIGRIGDPADAPARVGRVPASPLARRIASESGVPLASVAGTGVNGRITKRDVLAALATVAPDPARSGSAAAAVAPATVEPAPANAPTPPPVSGNVTVQPLSRQQSLIARRMADGHRRVPDFQVTMDVDMEAAGELRGRIGRLSDDRPPSYNDLIVKACALALREHPRANGAFHDDAWHLAAHVNVGVAVAAEGALIVPVVHDADLRPLTEIALETRRLATRVRNGEITPAELDGATFTVSNLGMYGVRDFTAVINPPQAAILAVGELAPRPVVRDGELAVRTTMTLTMSSDHRILYGADAAVFLGRIRDLLQEPLALLVTR